MGLLFYKSFPKPDWLSDQDKAHEYLDKADLSPLSIGTEVQIRNPWLLINTREKLTCFYDVLNEITLILYGNLRTTHPGQIVNDLVRLDKESLARNIPEPGTWVTIESIESDTFWCTLAKNTNTNYNYVYMPIWLIRRTEWKERYNEKPSLSKSSLFRCPLCGSRADALFVGCCCLNNKCSNWRK